MNTAYIATGDGAEVPAKSQPSRFGVFAYGFAAYGIGMGALFWLIVSLTGLAPTGFAGVEIQTVWAAVALNVALLTAFGVQHTIMARPRFKDWMTRHVPEAAERSTFVLAAGAVLWVAIAFWQPLPEIAWSVDNAFATWALWGLFGLGWGYLVLASFAINHFDLFGLRQVFLYWRGKPYRELPFQRRWMYRFSRHPLMAGVLVGVWAAPVMTFGHLVLAVTLTAYVFIGIGFEERDLIRSFGDGYREYMREVGKFTPWF